VAQLAGKSDALEQQAFASNERNMRLVNEARIVTYLIFILSFEILAGGSGNGSEQGA